MRVKVVLAWHGQGARGKESSHARRRKRRRRKTRRRGIQKIPACSKSSPTEDGEPSSNHRPASTLLSVASTAPHAAAGPLQFAPSNGRVPFLATKRPSEPLARSNIKKVRSTGDSPSSSLLALQTTSSALSPPVAVATGSRHPPHRPPMPRSLARHRVQTIEDELKSVNREKGIRKQEKPVQVCLSSFLSFSSPN
jgi:hypothetical protein